MTRPSKSITQERILLAPPESVFAAWSEPEGLCAWMCPGEIPKASVELDFRVGGRFRIEMHDSAQTYVQHGEYLEIDAPQRLVFSWFSEWMPEGERDTRVTVTFEAYEDEATLLRLVHDLLPESDSYDGHREGWASILEKLDDYVTG